MSLRKFHLVQRPASNHDRSIRSCHWHAEEVTFALLRAFIWDFNGKWLHDEIRKRIRVVASQVFRQSETDQSTVAKPEHCGLCLLHAVCGELEDHEIFAPITRPRATTCILVLAPRPDCGSTFGLVVHGESRVIRRFQFRPDSFFIGVSIYVEVVR